MSLCHPPALSSRGHRHASWRRLSPVPPPPSPWPPSAPPAIHDAPVATLRCRPSASSSVPPPRRLHGDGSCTNPARRAGPTPRRGRAPLVDDGGGGPLQLGGAADLLCPLPLPSCGGCGYSSPRAGGLASTQQRRTRGQINIHGITW